MRTVIVYLAFALSDASDILEKPSKNVQPIRVSFARFSREGIGEPNFKPPIDLSELDTVIANDPEKIEKLKKTGKYKLEKILRGSEPGYRKMSIKVENTTQVDSTPNPLYLDLARIHRRNLHNPFNRMRTGLFDMKPSYQLPSMYANVDRNITAKLKPAAHIDKDVLLKGSENMTTCDEFGQKPDFDPKEIVDIDWVPFYVWTAVRETKLVAHIHRISFPTKEKTKKYKDELGPYLNKKVKWNNPKLLMNEIGGNHMEMLLIALNRFGLFDGIPYTEIPKPLHMSTIQLPVLPVRMKIVDPYLAIMFCDFPIYAMIMAVSGNEPTELIKSLREAKVLNFRGPGTAVTRDIESEALEAFLEREEELQKNREKMTESPSAEVIANGAKFDQ